MSSGQKAVIGLLSLVYVGAIAYLVDLNVLLSALGGFSGAALTKAAFLVVLANLLALARSGSVLKALGFPPAWRDLYLAFSASGIANLPLNVVGQSLTRAMVLRNAGIPFGVSVMATYVERLLAAGLLFLFSLIGLWYLFGAIHLDIRQAAAVLTTIAGMAVVVSAAGLTLHRRQILARGAAFARWAPRLWPAAVLTILGHGAGLGAYLVLLSDLAPHSVSPALAAAIVIVMLVTALPISFAGWGLRELSAASAFGLVGVAAELSVAAALMIGLLYLAATGLFAVAGLPVWARVARRRVEAGPEEPPTADRSGRRQDWDARIIMGCAIACALLLFFRVPTAFGNSGNPVNVNVADIAVFVGLGVILLMMAAGRMRNLFPPALASALAGISYLLVLGLAISYGKDNLGSWAIQTRGVGWVLMLGYAALGAAIANIAGESGRILVLRTFVAAGLTVCVLQVGALVFSAFVFPVPGYVLAYPLQGFANNQNAFAFELAMVGTLMIAGRNLGIVSPRAFSAGIAVMAITIYLTGSRTGAVFLIVLALLDYLWPKLSGTAWCRATLVAAIAVVVVTLLPYAVLLLSPLLESAFGIVVDTDALFAALSHPAQRVDPENTMLMHPAADIERWKTIVGGLAIWRDSPFLGAGLGAYVQSVLASGQPLHGIHSIYIWFLAEMGIAGLIALIGMGALVALWAWKAMKLEPTRPWSFALLGILAFMAIGGLVQDFFFQRIFWFVLGLTATVGASRANPRPVNPPFLHDRMFLVTVIGFGLVVLLLAL